MGLVASIPLTQLKRTKSTKSSKEIKYKVVHIPSALDRKTNASSPNAEYFSCTHQILKPLETYKGTLTHVESYFSSKKTL